MIGSAVNEPPDGLRLRTSRSLRSERPPKISFALPSSVPITQCGSGTLFPFSKKANLP